MRRWGIVISVAYAMVLVGLIIPGTLWSAGRMDLLGPALRDAFMWTWLAALVTCEALLLFVRVDMSAKRPARRRPLIISAAVTGFAMALLSYAAVTSIAVTAFGDDDQGFYLIENGTTAAFLVACIWTFWGVVFYRQSHPAPTIFDRAVGQLLRGSVLELLIVVPCHVLVRRRDDCSAPIVTGYGIATGLAVMLLAFGPSIAVLYRARLQKYRSADGDRHQTGRRHRALSTVPRKIPRRSAILPHRSGRHPPSTAH